MTTDPFCICHGTGARMCLDALQSLFDPIEIAVGVIFLALGCYTGFLILKYSPKEMRPYKWFLLNSQVENFF